METETINRLFLELSQFTTAKTALELALEAEVERLREAYERTSFAAIQAQLRKHGGHTDECASVDVRPGSGQLDCDCGWAAIEEGLG